MVTDKAGGAAKAVLGGVDEAREAAKAATSQAASMVTGTAGEAAKVTRAVTDEAVGGAAKVATSRVADKADETAKALTGKASKVKQGALGKFASAKKSARAGAVGVLDAAVGGAKAAELAAENARFELALKNATTAFERGELKIRHRLKIKEIEEKYRDAAEGRERTFKRKEPSGGSSGL